MLKRINEKVGRLEEMGKGKTLKGLYQYLYAEGTNRQKYINLNNFLRGKTKTVSLEYIKKLCLYLELEPNKLFNVK